MTMESQITFTPLAFEGHGYVRTFRVNVDGSMNVAARFVHTNAYKIKKDAQRFCITGLVTNLKKTIFFRQRRKHRKTRNDVANTPIYHWGDELLADYEGGEPYTMLCPHTLETRGVEIFNSSLTNGHYVGFLVHMSIDHDNGGILGASAGHP